jgi:hypothetical protein
MFFMSAAEKARSVCVHTFPSLPVLNPSAVTDTSFTIAPTFFAHSAVQHS